MLLIELLGRESRDVLACLLPLHWLPWSTFGYE